MHAFYADEFVLPLPEGHRFPMSKYRLVRERCITDGVLRPEELEVPPAASWEDLALVHTPEYLANVRDGTLTPLQQRRIGFPWSRGMVERSRRSVGATCAAARTALSAAGGGWGVAANLAGGTHHAFAAHGEGFCVFNDAAVAIRVLQREALITRAAIIDCDVHQGNGSAAIFRADPSVFTFSVHGARNFPFRKERSTLDVELPDGAGDEAFLSALDLHVPVILDEFQPELVIYLAGADPYHGDRFGRLAMSKAGLAARDTLVLGACKGRDIPVAVAMAGGYARDVEDIVDIHAATIATADALSRDAGTVRKIPPADRRGRDTEVQRRPTALPEVR